MNEQTISHDDPRLSWHGAVSLERTADWTMPWRLPHTQRELFPPDMLLERAMMPAGVRIAFHSDTDFVAGEFEPVPDLAPIDICCNGNVVASLPLGGRDRFRFDHLPPGDKFIELWLPQFGAFRLRSLQIAAGAGVTPYEDKRPRWITYGSSISHCRTAASPTQTWPAIVARKRGLNLTCLGFGGQCHLDPMVARLIRDLPADLISLCVGINMHGGSVSPRTFRPGIIGFVKIIREKHPDTPMAVISPIISPPREKEVEGGVWTLPRMREEVAAAVAALRQHGDGAIHYFDGTELFGAESVHLLPDELHPDTEGYRVLGRRFLDRVIPVLCAR